MELFDTVNVNVAYTTAIEYADFSGLHDDDTKKINDWLATLPANTTFDWRAAVGLRQCEICGLMADCVKLDIYEA